MGLDLPAWFGPFVLICLVVGALLRGGADERLATAGLIMNVFFTRLLRDQTWPHVQWTGFAVDVLFTALLFAIALRSAKYWPLCAAAFQLLATLTHVAKLVDRHVEQWAYITAIVIWTYALIVTVGVGVWNNWRDRSYRASAGAPFAPVDTRR